MSYESIIASSYESISALIGSFGFPIFMCLVMAWYINNTHKELINVMHQVNKTLKGVLTKLNIEEGGDDND